MHESPWSPHRLNAEKTRRSPTVVDALDFRISRYDDYSRTTYPQRSVIILAVFGRVIFLHSIESSSSRGLV